ncbi:MAG: energy transducer TonB [Saprospiraceae bacterium]
MMDSKKITKKVFHYIAMLALILFGWGGLSSLNGQQMNADVHRMYFNQEGQEVLATDDYSRYEEIYTTATRDSVYVKKYYKSTGLYAEGGYRHYRDKEKQKLLGVHTSYFRDSLVEKTININRFYDAEGVLLELRSFYKSGVPKRIEYYESTGEVAKSTCFNEEGTERDYTPFEQMPRFSGCEDVGTLPEKKECAQNELLKFLYSNINYPARARENGIQGTVVVTFVIEKDGSLSNIELAKDIGAGCGEEAVRVVRMMPPFIPGMQDDELVRVQFNLPIKFKLEGRSRKKKRHKTE